MDRRVLYLLPLLLLYLILVLFFGSNHLDGDELRYIKYADNLIHGYYINTDFPGIYNGPGYPLLIAPLLKMGIPLYWIKVLNAFFLFGAVWNMLRLFDLYLSPRRAMLCTYLFGVYPVTFRWLPTIYAEPLVFLLLTSFMYYAIRYMRAEKRYSRTFFVAGFLLGYVALTKYVFIYLILALIPALLVLYVLSKEQVYALFGRLLVVGALVYSPFVVHNLWATNHLVLTGNNGAEIFYWRSTPYPDEWGDWFSFHVVEGREKIENLEPWGLERLQAHHLDFIRELNGLPLSERNERLKERSFANIRNNPVNYARNTLASFLRMFFNFPYSYSTQKFHSLGYMVPGAFLFVFTMLGIGLALFYYHALLPELVPLFLLGLTYIGVLTLLNGTARNLLVIMPILFLFNGYVWNCLAQIRIRPGLRERTV